VCVENIKADSHRPEKANAMGTCAENSKSDAIPCEVSGRHAFRHQALFWFD
jgi:hypothetical protein